MLYPKREQPLSAGDFKNPGSEYRGTPFWAWNNKLDKNELVWQIEQLKKLGYGGFHMHVRTGMATEYLSDEYMEIVRACVEKAREEKMLAWLYDEDRWPSGAAGGIVTRNPQYRIRHLLLTRKPYGSPGNMPKEPVSRRIGRMENGELLACFDITLDKKGDLADYKRIDEKDTPRGFKLYAYSETPLPDPWYNNQTYANTLDPDTIKEFIRVTYERYGKYFSKDFGGIIPAIFTDEPQFSRKGTLNFAREEKDVALPWTTDLTKTYAAAYKGEDLLSGVPELLWDLPGGKVSLVRYHYHDHLVERFTGAFADLCGGWCKEHGLMLTGHMMEEPTLESQTSSIGEAMRSYRGFQLPGIDMLCDRHEFTTAKQAQSAAYQFGCPGVLSELYGVTNWDYDFRGHKLQGDWQAALGVTVRVPHLSWVSMNGEAKRDYPSTFNYQSPWYEQYPYVEDHFARVASVMTRGRVLVRVGVVHPIESYWLHWGPREKTASVREEMDRNFQHLCEWLIRGLIDFNYICESTLPDLCKIEDIAPRQGGAVRFPVGKMAYDVIIVPAMETIRGSTLERLWAFKKAGGRLIFFGDAPKYMDALPSEEGKKLREQSEQVGFERLPILAAIEDVRELDIRDSTGTETSGIISQLREEGEGAGRVRWLFLAHADNPANPDLPQGDIIRISLKGQWAATLYDTVTGEIIPLPVTQAEGWTTISRAFYEHDSILVRYDQSRPLLEGPAPQLVSSLGLDGRSTLVASSPCTRFTTPVPVTLEEPNVLLLDIAEYALDGGAWRPAEEILRLDNLLRHELGWPRRGGQVAQPWVENDTSTPHTLKLRYSFDSELAFTGLELALENACQAAVTLNGEKADPPSGWYVDKCIGKVKLPALKLGRNILEVSLPYGRKVDVEAMYLLGGFGARVTGTSCTLTAPVLSLGFGDITRQGLPFYGGNLTYHLEAESRGGAMVITASSYRGHLLRVKVDGIDRGVIAYSPYRLEVPGLSKGKHKVDLVYFGSRVNTFGQLHANIRDTYWWGPNSWRSLDAGWTYEYRFWPQGVLKSPEIE